MVEAIKGIDFVEAPAPVVVERPAFDWDRFDGKKILITGADGFMGRTMVEVVDNGLNEIYPMIHSDKPTAIWKPLSAHVGRVLPADLRDYREVERAVIQSSPDIVFHFAAITQVTEAIRHPITTWETNVMGTMNLLEACRIHAPHATLVLASSDKAYGDQGKRVLFEDDRLLPGHPYDTSKMAMEIAAMSYAKQFGQSLAIARMGNLFGPYDYNWRRLIPGGIRSLMLGQPFVLRSDGSMEREYIYAPIAAKAYLHMAQGLMEGWVYSGDVFNFGGCPFTVKEVAEIIIEIMGKDKNMLRIMGIAKDESPAIVLDDSKARRYFQWSYKNKQAFVDHLMETIDIYRMEFGGLAE